MEKTNIKSGPKDVFSYLLAIAALYFATINFITLVFGYVNLYFPNISENYGQNLGSLRFSIASLLILFPVYLIASWLINKDIKNNPKKSDIKIRKWLIYLTLFIAALVIIGDLVTVVYRLLEGDLTIRFILKILTVLAVAGGIFAYYIAELRGNSPMIRRYSAIASSIAVAIVIISGFFVVGSPIEQRLKNLDNIRINHLQTIQGQVVNYWINKDKLPDNLSELQDDISGFSAPVDPETQMPYDYTVKGDLTFELCAEFKTSSNELNQRGPRPPEQYYERGLSNNWQYSPGLTCFERTIDPDFYNRR